MALLSFLPPPSVARLPNCDITRGLLLPGNSVWGIPSNGDDWLLPLPNFVGPKPNPIIGDIWVGNVQGPAIPDRLGLISADVTTGGVMVALFVASEELLPPNTDDRFVNEE